MPDTRCALLHTWRLDRSIPGYPGGESSRGEQDGERSMDYQTRARGTARQLVNLTRFGDLDTVSLMVRLLADPGQRPQLRRVLAELLCASAAMVLRQVGDDEPGGAIMLDLRKVDGSTVDIDQLRPEVRAMVRALLAEAHGHPEDSEAQIALALAGKPTGLTEGITMVLMWTVSALRWCESHAEPTPGWLDTTAYERRSHGRAGSHQDGSAPHG